ncbi:squalene synthetase-like protein [Linderina macrospora]|uniref:Squalene synthetase-like protein n=1 Tax=Linderina macrospora TaxID=4868 RepID=A0ACC1JE22_9FUNG|nr:squalene synthetase-like protein [Linderina macrospora]
MDDLFVIDTQGSKTDNVPTTETSREFTVVTASNQPRPKQRKQRARVITDNISDDRSNTTQRSTPSRQPRKQKGRPMAGLDQKFLALNVSDSSGGKKKNAKKRNKKQKDTREPYVNRYQPPPRLSGRKDWIADAKDSIADYVSNLGVEGISNLMKQTLAMSSFATRELGSASADVVLPTSAAASDGSGSDHPSDNEFDYDDPYAFDDDIADAVLQGSGVQTHIGSDSDGQPDDDDSEVFEMLPNPDKQAKKAARQKQKYRESVKRERQVQQTIVNKHQVMYAKGDKPTAGFDPRTVVQRLESLARDADVDTIWLQPLNTFERRIVHILANEYNIKSNSKGSKTNRMPVLTRTAKTCRPKTMKRINKLLLLWDEGGLIPEYWSGGTRASWDRTVPKAKKGNGRSGRGSGSGSATPRQNKMVGEGAPAVGEANIGHQMLKQMGWAPGQGLGAGEEGRATPVDVMIRSGRQGLGA